MFARVVGDFGLLLRRTSLRRGLRPLLGPGVFFFFFFSPGRACQRYNNEVLLFNFTLQCPHVMFDVARQQRLRSQVPRQMLLLFIARRCLPDWPAKRAARQLPPHNLMKCENVHLTKCLRTLRARLKIRTRRLAHTCSVPSGRAQCERNAVLLA